MLESMESYARVAQKHWIGSYMLIWLVHTLVWKSCSVKKIGFRHKESGATSWFPTKALLMWDESIICIQGMGKLLLDLVLGSY